MLTGKFDNSVDQLVRIDSSWLNVEPHLINPHYTWQLIRVITMKKKSITVIVNPDVRMLSKYLT